MSREYGAVKSKFWDWARRNKLSVEAKTIAVYLLTCSHSNSIGCYRIPLMYVSYDTGYPIETVLKQFEYLSKTGLIQYSEDFEYVFIENYLLENPPQNNNQVIGLCKRLQEIPPETGFIPQIIDKMRVFSENIDSIVSKFGVNLTKGFETVSEPIANKDQDQDQDQDQDHSIVSSDEDMSDLSDSDSETPQGSNCPHQEIVDLYHQILPALPKVREWGESRKKLLRARWRENVERQSIDWWTGFFKQVSNSDFLMGRAKDFMADLEWLVKPKNFGKVLNGRFDNRKPNTGSSVIQFPRNGVVSNVQNEVAAFLGGE